jgi:hypothetical protein
MEAVRAFRDAAVADGWLIDATYKTESVDRASTLQKDGYTMQVITREPQGDMNASANVHVWGPDGLSIKPPTVYSFDSLKQVSRCCQYCSAVDVETVRVGFAGRACKPCAPVEEKKLGRNYYE